MARKSHRVLLRTFVHVVFLIWLAAVGHHDAVAKSEGKYAPGASFQQLLNSAAEENHIAIVAEGRPLVDPLPMQAETALQNALSTAKTVDEKVAVIGSAFDYNSRRDEAGIYRLSKRYSDSRDLPFVSPEESSTDFHRIIACILKVADVVHDPLERSEKVFGLCVRFHFAVSLFVA